MITIPTKRDIEWLLHFYSGEVQDHISSQLSSFIFILGCENFTNDESERISFFIFLLNQPWRMHAKSAGLNEISLPQCFFLIRMEAKKNFVIN